MKGIANAKGFTSLAGYGAPAVQPAKRHKPQQVTVFLRRPDDTEFDDQF